MNCVAFSTVILNDPLYPPNALEPFSSTGDPVAAAGPLSATVIVNGYVVTLTGSHLAQPNRAAK